MPKQLFCHCFVNNIHMQSDEFFILFRYWQDIQWIYSWPFSVCLFLYKRSKSYPWIMDWVYWGYLKQKTGQWHRNFHSHYSAFAVIHIFFFLFFELTFALCCFCYFLDVILFYLSVVIHSISVLFIFRLSQELTTVQPFHFFF